MKSTHDTLSWWRSSVGEAEAASARDAILGEHLTQGPCAEEFEKALSGALQVPYVVTASTGTTALVMSMMAAGIKPGDEVIVPNRTWIATANAPALLGAKVVLVDVLPDRPLMDTAQLRRKITGKTRAIIPVHLNGRSVDMNEVNETARQHGLVVVEDACQSLFSRNHSGFLGTQSDMGCFSFGVTKLITTGLGGAVVTRDRQLYEALKLIRSNGTPTNITPTYSNIGCNFKCSDILASIGSIQLSQAEDKIRHLKTVYHRYKEGLRALPWIRLLEIQTDYEIPLYVEVLCKQRKELFEHLNSLGIFPRPALPNLDAAQFLATSEKFPHAAIFAEEGLFLPCGSAQPLQNVDRVIEALVLFGKKQNL